MVDFTRLKRLESWPPPIGAKLIHRTWTYQTDADLVRDSIKVIDHHTDPHTFQPRIGARSGTSDYLYNYGESSFAPITEWYFLDKVEVRKSGFGKFISRIETNAR